MANEQILHLTPRATGGHPALRYEAADGAFASVEIQDLTYTARLRGAEGNKIWIEYLDTETAGAETITVSTLPNDPDGRLISIGMEDGVSTATEIETAFNADVTALALVGVAVSGTGATEQDAVDATALSGGFSGSMRNWPGDPDSELPIVSIKNPINVFTHSTVTADDTTAELLAANSKRKYALFQNVDASVNAFIKFDADAVEDEGIRIGSGESYEINAFNLFLGAVNVITPTGVTADILVTEGTSTSAP